MDLLQNGLMRFRNIVYSMFLFEIEEQQYEIIKVQFIFFLIKILDLILAMEAQKKLSHIFARKRSTKEPSFSHIEQVAGNALIDIISHFEGENKRIGSFIEINKVVEVPNGKEKPSVLVYFSYKSRKVLLLPIQKKLISELEKKLKTTVLLVCARNIQSRWIKKNRTQKRPYSRTLTSVYEQLLTELLLPGIIISDRTRVRLDGTSVRKLVLDKADEHYFEDRSQAIINAYKKLTNREIQIGFEKEPVYYVLKKGEKK